MIFCFGSFFILVSSVAFLLCVLCLVFIIIFLFVVSYCFLFSLVYPTPRLLWLLPPSIIVLSLCCVGVGICVV